MLGSLGTLGKFKGSFQTRDQPIISPTSRNRAKTCPDGDPSPEKISPQIFMTPEAKMFTHWSRSPYYFHRTGAASRPEVPRRWQDSRLSTVLKPALIDRFPALWRVLVGLVYSTTFEHRLDNTTTYKAYDAIQEWVRTQGGKVKENHRPTLIVAVFGSSSKGNPWEKKARKAMRFELTQPGSHLLVKVHVSSSLLKDSDVASHGDEARFNWSQTLETLWARLGGREAEKKTHTNPPAIWTRSLRRGKTMTRLGLIITVVGYVSVLFSQTITSLVISGVGLIILVNGMTRVRSAKKNLSLIKER